jgi:hypothetical protein
MAGNVDARRKFLIGHQFVYHLLGFYGENGVDIRQPKWLEPPSGDAWLGHRLMKNNFSLRSRWLWLRSPFLASHALPGAVHADPYQGKAITFEFAIARSAVPKTVRVTSTDVYRDKLPLRHDRADLVFGFHGHKVTNRREAERAYSASLSAMQTTRSVPRETVSLSE